MAHPVVEAHMGASAIDAGAYGRHGQDTPTGPVGPVDLGGRTPHAVALFALAALFGVVLLRLSGFRFAVGGSIGG